MPYRAISRGDYQKAIRHAVSWLTESDKQNMDLPDLEEGVLAVASRLKVQMQIAGLMSRGYKIPEIAADIKVDGSNVGKYLDGKQTPRIKTRYELERCYLLNKKFLREVS